MAAFVTVTTRGMTSQRLLVNLDAVAWMVSIAPQTTRLYFASLPGSERHLDMPFMLEVAESPEEIARRAEQRTTTAGAGPGDCVASRQSRRRRVWRSAPLTDRPADLASR